MGLPQGGAGRGESGSPTADIPGEAETRGVEPEGSTRRQYAQRGTWYVACRRCAFG